MGKQIEVRILENFDMGGKSYRKNTIVKMDDEQADRLEKGGFVDVDITASERKAVEELQAKIKELEGQIADAKNKNIKDKDVKKK